MFFVAPTLQVLSKETINRYGKITEEEINQEIHSIINYQSHALRSLARWFSALKQVHCYFPSTTLTMHHCEEFAQIAVSSCYG